MTSISRSSPARSWALSESREAGKKLSGRTILRLVEPTAGEIYFEGQDILRFKSRDFRSIRRRTQIIFQDPYATLNPGMQIKQIIAEPLLFHKMIPPKKVESRVIESLAKVGMEAYFRIMYDIPRFKPNNLTFMVFNVSLLNCLIKWGQQAVRKLRFLAIIAE